MEADAVDKLDQAVSLALHGSQDLKGQALEFVSQVESDAASWLRPCLSIVVEGNKSDTTQFFALQIVDRAITSTPDMAVLEHVRSSIWARTNQLAGLEVPKHVRNKFAELLKSLFVRLYAEGWKSFFSDLVQLAMASKFGGEFYAQVLLAVHGEIGDQLFARTSEEQARANALKDLVRDRDMRMIGESWVHFLSTGDDQLIDLIIQVIAGWAVWTDVTVVLPTVPYIEKHLCNQTTRNSAASALVEILSKKMPTPELKLELLQTTQIVAALRSVGTPDTPEFGEMFARVVNAAFLEPVRALLELSPASESSTAQSLHSVVADVFPFVIEYFENEFDDTSAQLIPSITDFLAYLRRDSRRQNDKPSSIIGGNLTPQQTQYLRALLASLVKKSRYEEGDYELGELGEEDGEEEFTDFRAKLRVLQEQLAQIDTLVYLEVVSTFVNDILQMKPQTALLGDVSADWTALELALYELSVYSDVARLFVTKGLKYGSGLQELATSTQNTQYVLFGEMVVSGAQQAPGWQHPANQLWYMQLAQRHAGQFLLGKTEEHRHLLTQCLDFFVKNGVQSSMLKVRVQSWYMFYRLAKAVKRSTLIADHAVCLMIFEALAPSLPVQVSSSASTTSVEELGNVVQDDAVFNSQLYLYELCGILFAIGEDRSRSAELMRQLLSTMFSNIDTATTQMADSERYLTVHHNIVALSSLTKGISDTISETPNAGIDELSAQLKTATQMVVAVLETSHQVQIVREACRQVFSRLLSLLEDKIIVEISSFIDVLLQTSTPADLPEFLSFLGQLAHQFASNPQIFEMFSSLSVPLFEKIFGALQQVAQTADVDAVGSTDAQIFRRDFVNSYLQLLTNLQNNNYGAMLFIDPALFDSIFRSLLHYASNGDVKDGAGSAGNQKLAVGILTKMVVMWGPQGKVQAPNFGADMIVPLFSEPATYERLTELCWTLPTSQNFNIQDAQSRMVLAELAGLQKALCETRGSEYEAYLVQYLSGAGLDSVALQEFAGNVGNSLKDFKRYFVDLVQKALTR